jgi:hypothetical protein
MLIREITNKPFNAQQARINGLKLQKDNATKALKKERNRQRIAKAQQTIASVKSSS